MMVVKVCTKCGQEKPESAFPFNSYRRKDGTQARASACRECKNVVNRQRNKRCRHKWYLRRLEQERAGRLRCKFGITVEQYDLMLNKQHGVCKICGKAPGSRRLAVDHDHKTNKVRGLLCYHCNTMLGLGRDSPTILRLAAIYLEENTDE